MSGGGVFVRRGSLSEKTPRTVNERVVRILLEFLSIGCKLCENNLRLRKYISLCKLMTDSRARDIWVEASSYQLHAS